MPRGAYDKGTLSILKEMTFNVIEIQNFGMHFSLDLLKSTLYYLLHIQLHLWSQKMTSEPGDQVTFCEYLDLNVWSLDKGRSDG